MTAATQPHDAADQRLAMLQELAEIGMSLARLVRDEAVAAAAAPEAKPAADLNLRFCRIARAVRQTLALQARMEDDTARRREVAERAAQTRRQRQDDEARRARANEGRRRESDAADIVEKLIELDGGGAERIEALDAWRDEREYEEMAERAVGDIVYEICQALGLAPDFSLWIDEPWAFEALKAEVEAADARLFPVRRRLSPAPS